MATVAKFYVYEHWRPDKDVCFYVGKGKGDRAWGFRRRNPYYRNIVAKLAALGMCVEVRLVRSGMDEDSAFELEKASGKTRNIGQESSNPGGVRPPKLEEV